MGIIYCLTSPSGKKYIGQTTRDFDKRFEEHCKRKECRILHNAIQKYGQDNFKKEILLECNNYFLDEYEIKFINLYSNYSFMSKSYLPDITLFYPPILPFL